MLKIRDLVRIISCKVIIEDRSYMKNFEGNLEEHPAYSEIYIPTNYCPMCGKKLGGGVNKI